MSDLTQLRDHAQMMAGRDHAAGCPPVRSRPGLAKIRDNEKWCRRKDAHAEHLWTEPSRFGDYDYTWACHGICGGCLPAAERALWRQIADEIVAHLDRPVGEDLFGDLTTEPITMEDA